MFRINPSYFRDTPDTLQRRDEVLTKPYSVLGSVQCSLYIISYSHKNLQRLMLFILFYGEETALGGVKHLV